MGTLVHIRLMSRKPGEEQSKVALKVRQDMKVYTVKPRNIEERAGGFGAMGGCCQASTI